ATPCGSLKAYHGLGLDGVREYPSSRDQSLGCYSHPRQSQARHPRPPLSNSEVRDQTEWSMPRITLPDGKVKEFPGPVTARDVAASIGPRLAKDALGAKIDGELRDLSTPIDHDAQVAIVTEKKRDGTTDPDALFLARHSAAHVMAEAIQRVFGDQVQLAY